VTTTRRADRRSEILVAAAALFAERGFHGVSIDDLGARLGVSGPALYRYFESKEAILAEMLVSISERLLRGAHACVDEGASPAVTLTALIGFHVDFALTEPDLIAVQFRDLGNVPEPSRRKVRRLQREYVDLWVDTLVQVHPGTSREQASSAAQAVFGLLNSTPHSRRLATDEMSRLLGSMAEAALAAGCQHE
jgi:AcrR family transcriptional regulator